MDSGDFAKVHLMEHSPETTVTIERALDLTGYGKYTVLFTLACGLCLCGATAEIYSVGFILPAAECDLDLDTASKSLLAGSGIMGMIATANLWGFLSDRYGRKKAIICGGFGGAFCSFLALLSRSFWPFVVFRCLSGAFITGCLTTLFAYSGEFLPQKYRSKSIVFIGILQNFNSIYIPALAWVLLPSNASFNIFGYEYNSWRIFLFVNIIPLFLGTFSIFFFPESPKYLLSTGDLDTTIKTLKNIHKVNNGNSNAWTVKKILFEIEDGTKKMGSTFFENLKDQVMFLFQRKHILNMFCTSYLQFCNFAVSSGLLIWYADILNIQKEGDLNLTVCEAITMGKNVTSKCDDNVSSFNSSMFSQNLWIGLLYIVGQLVIIFALKYFRKTILQAIFTTIAGLSALVMLFIKSGILINIFFVIFLVLPGLCVVIVNALVVDLFPTQLRSSAISFSLTMGRISSLLTTSIVGHLIKFNCIFTFSIYAFAMISCGFVAILMRSKDTPLLKLDQQNRSSKP